MKRNTYIPVEGRKHCQCTESKGAYHLKWRKRKRFQNKNYFFTSQLRQYETVGLYLDSMWTLTHEASNKKVLFSHQICVSMKPWVCVWIQCENWCTRRQSKKYFSHHSYVNMKLWVCVWIQCEHWCKMRQAKKYFFTSELRQYETVGLCLDSTWTQTHEASNKYDQFKAEQEGQVWFEILKWVSWK